MSNRAAPTPANRSSMPSEVVGSAGTGGVSDRRLVIVGAGGFGREVNDIVVALQHDGQPLELLGHLDDHLTDTMLLDALGVRFLGAVDEWIRTFDDDAIRGGGSTGDDAHSIGFVVAIADPEVRRRVDGAMSERCVAASPLIHPAATVGVACRLGAGVVIAAGARLTTNIGLGRHVHVHVNATIGHDAELADHVAVLPGATVGGATRIGAGATIGTGANVLQGLTIGDGAYVGAGAVVVRDVAPATTVVGVPARPLHGDR